MWARIATALAGVWLMAAPAVLDYAGPARVNDRIFGPLATAFAIVAVSEVTRGLRWCVLPIGVWLVIVPWVLGYARVEAINSTVIGLLLIVLSFLGGRIRGRFGGGWSSLLKTDRHDA